MPLFWSIESWRPRRSRPGCSKLVRSTELYLRDPERDLYIRLMKALAPRLREIAPKLPHYEVERDAEFFAEFAGLADGIEEILAAFAANKPTIEKTAAGIDELVDRRGSPRVTRSSTSRRSAPSSTGSRSSA